MTNLTTRAARGLAARAAVTVLLATPAWSPGADKGKPTTAPTAIKADVPKEYAVQKLGDTGASVRVPPTWAVLPKAAQEGAAAKLVVGNRAAGSVIAVTVAPQQGEPVDPAEFVREAADDAREQLGSAPTPVSDLVLVSTEVVRLPAHRGTQVVMDGRTAVARAAKVRVCRVVVETKAYYYDFLLIATPDRFAKQYEEFKRVLVSADLP